VTPGAAPPTPARAGSPADASDGRTARAERTRDAVVDAFLALLDEGDLRPTARRVAERAGVSLRSVYVRFEDLDALALAAAERQWERVREVVRVIPPTGPLAERLDAFVEQRCRVLDAVAPVRRAAELQEPFNATLAPLLTWARGVSRDELARTFAPELEARPGATRERLLDALEVVAGTSTWDVLRRQRGRSTQAARAVVTDLLRALLRDRADQEG